MAQQHLLHHGHNGEFWPFWLADNPFHRLNTPSRQATQVQHLTYHCAYHLHKGVWLIGSVTSSKSFPWWRADDSLFLHHFPITETTTKFCTIAQWLASPVFPHHRPT